MTNVIYDIKNDISNTYHLNPNLDCNFIPLCESNDP